MYNDTLDYINEYPDKVENIKTTIINNRKKTKRTFLETLWNNQNNRIVERIDSGENLNYYEIIIETKIQEEPPIFEIIRAFRENDSLVPVLHSFITDNEDGSETEIKVI